MILLRKREDGPAEQLELEEFERRVREGEIAPNHLVCFPVVTGERFVHAGDLELFRGLYRTDTITFKRYFHLGRIPWLTSILIVALCYTYFGWQKGPPSSTEDLLRHGAKSLPLMLELGQWWRLITANFIHVSGWHLLVNAIFLFNLGGPAEAVFRRLDYVLVLVASALGTTLLSAVVNPQVSCGASGIVFGVWGAIATFGVRHREILPDRYRRYFIGSVIPYSIFALYMGIFVQGIDNWGHLGGLLSGSIIAVFFPSRLLRPHDALAAPKLLVLSGLTLFLALGSMLPIGVGSLTSNLYFPKNGLAVSVPRNWHRLIEHRSNNRETYAFHNRAGPVIGFETRLLEHPSTIDQFVSDFVEVDLAQQLELNNAQTIRLLDPDEVIIGGLPARHIRADIVTPTTASRASYYLISRGYFRYILSFNAPMWVAEHYEGLFARVLDELRIVEPDILTTARNKDAEHPTAATRAELARALATVGKSDQAVQMLEETMRQWPNSGEPFAVRARLLHEQDQPSDRACSLVRHAMAHQEWTPELMMLAVDLHAGCNELETAKRILEAARQRFPSNEVFTGYAFNIDSKGDLR